MTSGVDHDGPMQQPGDRLPLLTRGEARAVMAVFGELADEAQGGLRVAALDLQTLIGMRLPAAMVDPSIVTVRTPPHMHANVPYGDLIRTASRGARSQPFPPPGQPGRQPPPGHGYLPPGQPPHPRVRLPASAARASCVFDGPDRLRA
ncbi:hypothetical protein ACIPUC_14585 [Streptomyces sp. LARHCF249]